MGIFTAGGLKLIREHTKIMTEKEVHKTIRLKTFITAQKAGAASEEEAKKQRQIEA